MTKRFLFSAICAIAVCVAVSCGGGQSKSSSGESAADEKGVFGEVMTLVKEYQAKDDELDKKMDAAGEAQDVGKIEKIMDEQKALKSEFSGKLEAVSKKLAGTKIEYELPDSFFYQMSSEPVITEVTPNGLNAAGVIQFTVSAKSDLQVGKYKRDDYRVFLKLVDEAGATLGYRVGQTIADDRQPQEIKAGENLSPIELSFSLAENSKGASMAKIVFVSESEWEESLKNR